MSLYLLERARREYEVGRKRKTPGKLRIESTTIGCYHWRKPRKKKFGGYQRRSLGFAKSNRCNRYRFQKLLRSAARISQGIAISLDLDSTQNFRY